MSSKHLSRAFFEIGQELGDEKRPEEANGFEQADQYSNYLMVRIEEIVLELGGKKSDIEAAHRACAKAFIMTGYQKGFLDGQRSGK